MRSSHALTGLLLAALLATPASGSTPEEIARERSGEEGAAPGPLPVRDPIANARARAMLGGTGLLLIPDSTADRVMAFDPTTGDLVDADFIPADPTHLSTPKHAILSASGASILVSDQIDDVVQAYDFDGNWLGVFAPAGGANTAILDNILGIDLQPSGNLLVTVTGGANQDAIAEFDTTGAYVGNFAAPGAAGMDGPFDVQRILVAGGSLAFGDFLVPAITSDTVHRFNSAGAAQANLAAINNFPQQVHHVATGANAGNLLIGNFGGTQEGVVEITNAGVLVNVYDPVPGGGYRGVYELPNGNLLTTTGTGVHEISRAGVLVETKIAGVSAQYIELVTLGPGPEISLAKTVGTDASTCAVTDSIDLVGGGQVVYCYEVTNTGSITFSEHDLVDSELGTILDDFPFTLTPGATAFLTQTALITQTTVNTGTWTAFNPSPQLGGESATAVDTATVNIIAPAPAITLAKTVGTDSGTCAAGDVLNLPFGGGTVYYCYEVENTGNITLTRHDLVDSELGGILTNFPFTLVPGASAFLTHSALITQTTVNSATWTARLPPPPLGEGTGIEANASDSATVNIAAGAPAITLTKTVGTDPGSCALDTELLLADTATVYYCYSVENTGNVTFTTHDLVDSELGALLTDFQFVLGPGASAFLTASATISETTVNTADWTADDGQGNVATANSSATVTIERLGSVLEIPSVSSIGLAVLALALSLVAIQRVRGSRRA